LKGGVLSLGLALKSKDRMMSTARWGRRMSGYGELKVRPASTMYRRFSLVGCISNIPSKSSARKSYVSLVMHVCSNITRKTETS